MRKLIKIAGLPVLVCFVLLSCKKTSKETTVEPVSQDVLAKIIELGFSNKNVQPHSEGYPELRVFKRPGLLLKTGAAPAPVFL